MNRRQIVKACREAVKTVREGLERGQMGYPVDIKNDFTRGIRFILDKAPYYAEMKEYTMMEVEKFMGAYGVRRLPQLDPPEYNARLIEASERLTALFMSNLEKPSNQGTVDFCKAYYAYMQLLDMIRKPSAALIRERHLFELKEISKWHDGDELIDQLRGPTEAMLVERYNAFAASYGDGPLHENGIFLNLS
jgi:hypothetical protein